MTSDPDKAVSDALGGLNELVKKAVQVLSTNVVHNLIDTNPVLTGWSRANWVPSIGSDPMAVVGSPEAVVGSAQDAGMVSLGTYKLTDGPVYVSNNVHYVPTLNESHRTAAGFVDRSVQRAIHDSLAEVFARVRNSKGKYEPTPRLGGRSGR